MKLKNALNEKEQETNNYNNILLSSLKNVFSSNYIERIQPIVNKITYKEINASSNIVAYTVRGIGAGSATIVVNTSVFKGFSVDQKKRYLLHELIHVLQNTRKYFIASEFVELNRLGTNLNIICKTYLMGSLERFLANTQIKLESSGQNEIIPYLILGKQDWDQMKPEGQKKFVNKMMESGIFNVHTSFWQQRLPLIKNSQAPESSKEDAAGITRNVPSAVDTNYRTM